MYALRIDGPEVTRGPRGTVKHLPNAVKKANANENNGGMEVVVNQKGGLALVVSRASGGVSLSIRPTLILTRRTN